MCGRDEMMHDATDRERMLARRGNWIVTASGRKFFPFDPRSEDVDVRDIAHALARVCRFGGHTREFYSVAQHSVLVSHLVPDHLALHGLLHDAAEAYVGDVVRPLKAHMPEYRQVEARVFDAIRERCGLVQLNVVDWSTIKLADNAMLLAERRDLMPPTDRDWAEDEQPIEVPSSRIWPWLPHEAEKKFLQRWCDLRLAAEQEPFA